MRNPTHRWRFWPALLLLVALAGCGSALKGGVSQGIYTTPSRTYSVEVPVFHDQETTDGVAERSEWVTFRSDCCYWSPFGEYQVRWRLAGGQGSALTAEDLLTESIAEADREWVRPAMRGKGEFRSFGTETLTINGRKAVRAVGEMTIERERAVAAFTVIDFGDALALGILRCAVPAEATPESYTGFAEWGIYQGVLDSIRETGSH